MAALTAFLVGCAGSPAEWQAEIAPAVPVPVAAPAAPKARFCPPLDLAMVAETKRMTRLAGDSGNGLTAALISSEATKNVWLQRAIAAYERCRSGAG